MNKLAVFVEGQTEQVFVERLLREIAGNKEIEIKDCRPTGRRKGKPTHLHIEASTADSRNKFFVLIVDCGGDERVKSLIRDNYDSLVKKGYQAIIGIRDVFPEQRANIPKLRAGLHYRMKTVPIQVEFILAVMEIEAWFIAEYTHFRRLSNRLTVERIQSEIGFDPSTDDIELRDHPSEDIRNIYQLAGFAYNKSKTNVQRTVGLLDYANIYVELGQKINDLNCLLEQIDAFLSNG